MKLPTVMAGHRAGHLVWHLPLQMAGTGPARTGFLPFSDQVSC